MSRRCYYEPIGWRCSGRAGHFGPCPLWPRFWAHPILWWKMGRP